MTAEKEHRDNRIYLFYALGAAAVAAGLLAHFYFRRRYNPDAALKKVKQAYMSKSSIMEIVHWDDIECADEVLKKNPGLIHDRDSDWYAPLHHVRSKEMAQLLIRHGADINATNNDGITPLTHLAMCWPHGPRADDVGIARLLILNGADVNARDSYSFTALHRVRSRAMARLLIECGADVNAKTDDGETPLVYAVFRDAVKIARFLMANGADVNAKDDESMSLLHYVGSKALARLLIEKGLDVNAQSADGSTPLHTLFLQPDRWGEVARIRNIPSYNDGILLELVEYLISCGADVNAVNARGETPLKSFLRCADFCRLRKGTAGKLEKLLRDRKAH